jgi:multidrug efflux pump subunit AcrA (membrane-fusion protein)
MVFVRDGQSFRRVPVKTGVVDRDMTEILSGLDAGVVVATEGSHVVKAEFQLVQSAL